MNIATLLDAIPVVQSTTDRAAKFPSPLQDQRVYNKGSKQLERFDSGAWTAEVALNLVGLSRTVSAAGYPRGTSGVTADDNATAVNAAVAAAPGLGATAVLVDASLLPYTSTLVAFNPAVHMLVQGQGTVTDFDAHAYGAAGDGVADDYAALSNAILLMQTTPGGNGLLGGWTLRLREGKIYKVTKPLLVTQGDIKIKGSGRPESVGTSSLYGAFYGGPLICVAAPYNTVPTAAALASGPGSSFVPGNTLPTAQWFNLREARAGELNGLAALTAECYFKMAGALSDGAFLASNGYFGNQAVNGALLLGVNSGTWFCSLTTSNNGRVTLNAGSAPSAGTTYHVAVTYDGATLRLFVAGVLVASAAATGTVVQTIEEDVTVGAAIGRAPDAGPASLLPGGAGSGSAIDSVRLSNIARYTAGFAAPTAKFVNDANTLALFNFDVQNGPLTRMQTNLGGDAWLPLRSQTSPSGATPTAVELSDLHLVDGVVASLTGIYITNYAYRPKLNRIFVDNCRNGLLVQQGNNYAWRFGELYISTANAGRFGVQLAGFSGIGQLDTAWIQGFAVPLMVNTGVAFTNVFVQCTNDSYYGVVVASGDSGNISFNRLNINTEAGSNAGWIASLFLTGNSVTTAITFESLAIEGARNLAPIKHEFVGGATPSSITFVTPAFTAYGTAPSIFKRGNAAPGRPVLVINPTWGAAPIPLADNTGDVSVLVPGLKVVTFSATPTFDASIYSTFVMTLTGNVTSSTLSNVTPGQTVRWQITQDATGGRTFVWPTNVKNAPPVNPTPNAVTVATGVYDGTNVVLEPSTADAQLAGVTAAVASKTAAYTATSADFEINCDPTGGAFTVTLPTAGVNAGKIYRIKHKSASGNNVTVAPASGQIDNAASKVLSSLQSADVQFDGTNYWIS